MGVTTDLDKPIERVFFSVKNACGPGEPLLRKNLL
jgi:hypothetical protein